MFLTFSKYDMLLFFIPICFCSSDMNLTFPNSLAQLTTAVALNAGVFLSDHLMKPSFADFATRPPLLANLPTLANYSKYSMVLETTHAMNLRAV